MAKYREAPCESYEHFGGCTKGHKNAKQSGRCQTCSDYRARKGYVAVGNAKRHAEKNKYIE